ncbi:hypothetical protein D3C81_1432760 [compost metagenome]
MKWMESATAMEMMNTGIMLVMMFSLNPVALTRPMVQISDSTAIISGIHTPCQRRKLMYSNSEITSTTNGRKVLLSFSTMSVMAA